MPINFLNKTRNPLRRDRLCRSTKSSGYTTNPRRDRLIVSAQPSKLLHGHDQSVPAESPDELVKEHYHVHEAAYYVVSRAQPIGPCGGWVLAA